VSLLGLPKHNVAITDKPASLDWYKFFVRLVDYVQNIIPSVVVGSIQYNIVTTAVNVTASYGDWVEANAAGGLLLITLPNPATLPGALVGIAKSDASGNIVRAVGTINGVANFDLVAQNETLTLVSIGTGWRAT
jgi:hypothetical protein